MPCFGAKTVTADQGHVSERTAVRLFPTLWAMPNQALIWRKK
jgi:hypothetical protein